MADRTLNWGVSTDTTVTDYNIEYAPNVDGTPPDDGDFSTLDTVVGRLNNSYIHDDLGTLYWYRVNAENPYGAGPWSVPFRAWAIDPGDLCVVSGVFTDAQGQAREGDRVIVELSTEFGAIEDDVYQVGRFNVAEILTNANGQWSVNLPRQAIVVPANSFVQFTFRDATDSIIRGPEKKVIPDEASARYNDLETP